MVTFDSLIDERFDGKKLKCALHNNNCWYLVLSYGKLLQKVYEEMQEIGNQHGFKKGVAHAPTEDFASLAGAINASVMFYTMPAIIDLQREGCSSVANYDTVYYIYAVYGQYVANAASSKIFEEIEEHRFILEQALQLAPNNNQRHFFMHILDGMNAFDAMKCVHQNINIDIHGEIDA